MSEIMNKKNPGWKVFTKELMKQVSSYECDGTFALTKKILRTFLSVDLKKSLKFFKERGGFCDCKIIYNVM